jgi:UDP-glucose 4-epimerase
MVVLVTGGAGYVGSHCVFRLVECGHTVVVLNNLSQGHQAALPREALFMKGDLADHEILQHLFRRYRFDAVLHFAALSLVGESMRIPYTYLQENPSNALNLVRTMIDHGVRKIVLSSTANMFGSPSVLPIGEGANIDPSSPYGESKHMIERALIWAERIHGLRYACLRYFNAAGAHPNGKIGEDHRPETHLIPLVLDTAMGRLPHMTVFGNDYSTPDGTCIRDYVHVCDLAEAHVRVLNVLATRSCCYNIGTEKGSSVLEVVGAVERITGRSVAVRFGPRRPGDPAVLVASAAGIREELGWRPNFENVDAIIETA